jgi:DNA-binding MarR family transcriptional regulator
MIRDLTMNLYTISRCTHNYYARELRKLNITMGQFPFIMGVVENEGISQEKLSQTIMISKSTTAAIIRQLLDAGLITRTVDPNDRRNFRLFATEKALDLVPKIQDVINKCHSEILKDLSPIEAAVFLELVSKVRNRTESIMGRKPSA